MYFTLFCAIFCIRNIISRYTFAFRYISFSPTSPERGEGGMTSLDRGVGEIRLLILYKTRLCGFARRGAAEAVMISQLSLEGVQYVRLGLWNYERAF